MAELRAWAGSSEFRRAPIRTASRRAPTSTAMPVRVSQRCQEQQEKRTKPMKPAGSEQNPCNAVYRRPYRDRVIHLLALRAYKKPELLARLQRDGVMQKDKGSLAKILQQVAKWNAKDNSFSLKEYLFQSLQTDWPGYTEIDRQNLKLILSGKSTPSQNTTNTSQATSPGPSERDAPVGPAQPTEKFPSSSVPAPAREQKEIPNSNGEKNELGRLKQWHRLDFDEGIDVLVFLTPVWITEVKYIAIVSLEQRQRYKDDFNAEYEEYRNLHSLIGKTVKKFRQFQEQWKCLTPGSESYQALHHRILADYQQLQQGSPRYSEMKSRCLYLHNKLAHIQSRISEFDQL
ncbi:RNA polymerase II elongation factor ELL2-like [Melospiza melodia melodia]|uniref:RNA polymerase II elongation factor ELL2-like n=1 Tax=Melospiza melodia melodia TaxID=1914991 RepID=UPI002FD2953D